MASEIHFVNCQELHNPSFTPQFMPLEYEAPLDSGNQQAIGETAPAAANLLPPKEGLGDHVSELTTGSKDMGSAPYDDNTDSPYRDCGANIDLSSSSVIPSQVEKELQYEAPQFDTATQTQPRIMRPSCPPISTKSNQLSKNSGSLPDIQSDENTTHSLPNDQHQTSIPKVDAENHADSRQLEPTQRLDNPNTSGQLDDEVQFILSIARKKRKKKPTVDVTPRNGSQTSKSLSEIERSENLIHPMGQSERAHLPSTDLKTMASQDVYCALFGMSDAHDDSIKPALAGSLTCTDSSSIVSISKPPNSMKRKDREDQGINLPGDISQLTNPALNNSCSPTGTPLLYQCQQSSQNVSTVQPLAGLPDMSGINPAGAGKPESGSEARCILSFDPQSPQINIISAQRQGHWQMGPVLNPNQVQFMSTPMIESLRRRPSLYGIPQWYASAPDRRVVFPAISANMAKSIHQNSDISKNGHSNGAPQIPSKQSESGTLSTPSSNTHCNSSSQQPLSNQQPIASSTSIQNLKPKHPRNMLVDIAQTCQDSFPFALIAKRHNQPIQKVFDTFSAVIQLPLLRSATDTRRPGKLGSFRMKEFNAMKRNAKQLPKEKQTRKEGKTADGKGNIGSKD